ncbi:MAG TPA: alpha/beta hydrolase, partial [Dehalococcoidia bacterium]|nr:alpha/beta hydrolase [Dehalococcoidia bacterium]
ATTRPEERLTESPAGDPVPLAEEEMPVAEAMVHIAVHSGQGNVMRRVIDPAVVDEGDPLLTDIALDMYHPANGRRPWPEPSQYDRSWLERYWRAQEERCRRLDVLARAYLAEHAAAGTADGGAEARYASERRRRLGRYIVVYRTLADPAYLDPTIDPSERPLGSMFTPGLDPVVGNYGLGGLGRVLTPRAWLSTWSPFSTNADLTHSLRYISCPCLFVQATGDTEIRPQEFAAIVASSAAADRTAVEVRGDHYLLPLEGQETDPRAQAADIIADWLAARVPPH